MKIAVAMSGGVDSSSAAAIIKRRRSRTCWFHDAIVESKSQYQHG